MNHKSIWEVSCARSIAFLKLDPSNKFMDVGNLPFPYPYQGLLQFHLREHQMESQVNQDLCLQTSEFKMEANPCLEDPQEATTYQH